MRSVTGTVLVVGALAATLVALLIPVWAFPGNTQAAGSSSSNVPDDGLGTVQTQYGPLTALDRDFARKVRLAGLWEGPTGQQAQTRSSDPAVKEAGKHLIDGHKELDERVLEVGQTLGIDLPSRPNQQQQEWLDILDKSRGAEYDYQFANIVRKAHGKVFSVVAQVRANTKNSMIRSLADRANAVVLDHITVLEKTGLVDYGALEDPGNPSPRPSTSDAPASLPPQTGNNPPAGSTTDATADSTSR